MKNKVKKSEASSREKIGMEKLPESSMQDDIIAELCRRSETVPISQQRAIEAFYRGYVIVEGRAVQYRK